MISYLINIINIGSYFITSSSDHNIKITFNREWDGVYLGIIGNNVIIVPLLEVSGVVSSVDVESDTSTRLPTSDSNSGIRSIFQGSVDININPRNITET